MLWPGLAATCGVLAVGRPDFSQFGGVTHLAEQRRYDEWRDEQLARAGIRVLRFTSGDVEMRLQDALDAIGAALGTPD